MKKLLLLAIVILCGVLDASAVLKEKNLDNTLHILRSELTTYHRELSTKTETNRQQADAIREQLVSMLRSSNQNSLMLYSQKQD